MFHKKTKMICTIEGMSCSHCAKRLEEALKEIDGVKVDVNLEKRIATITSSKEIDKTLIKEKIEKLGYSVMDIKVV